jgi:hypothetical protein
VLSRFRTGFYGCLTAQADALVELTDALVCTDGSVKTLVDLTLAPETRSSGSPARTTAWRMPSPPPAPSPAAPDTAPSGWGPNAESAAQRSTQQMAADNHTTIIGNLVEDPEVRFTNNGIAVTNLRIAVTQRIQQDSQWRDGDTSFFKVNVWRGQAEHCIERASCRRLTPAFFASSAWERAAPLTKQARSMATINRVEAADHSRNQLRPTGRVWADDHLPGGPPRRGASDTAFSGGLGFAHGASPGSVVALGPAAWAR